MLAWESPPSCDWLQTHGHTLVLQLHCTGHGVESVPVVGFDTRRLQVFRGVAEEAFVLWNRLSLRSGDIWLAPFILRLRLFRRNDTEAVFDESHSHSSANRADITARGSNCSAHLGFSHRLFHWICLLLFKGLILPLFLIPASPHMGVLLKSGRNQFWSSHLKQVHLQRP